MAKKTKKEAKTAQNPLILRSHRLMEAFAKSDEERDFYLDNVEGFIVYVDLDKSGEELETLEKELKNHSDRYCMIPKLTFYETKKIMEGFVHEKVYDIDTKEKLLDIIQSKEARENFLEFIYDHHSELEKWQQYYQERSRIRIIEWLREHNFHFVFEEDLDFSTSLIEKLKENLFEAKVGRDVEVARKSIATKAKTYYSNEALNPRPKRGRPPKQTVKVELEPQISSDIYTTVPQPVRPFLFIPEITSATEVTFSARFESGQELVAGAKALGEDVEEGVKNIAQKLAALRTLSNKWIEKEEVKKEPAQKKKREPAPKPKAAPKKKAAAPAKKPAAKKTPEKKRIIPEKKSAPAKTKAKAKPPAKKAPAKKAPAKKAADKTPAAKKKTHLRRTKSTPKGKTKK